jgi:hypothetical protein
MAADLSRLSGNARKIAEEIGHHGKLGEFLKTHPGIAADTEAIDLYMHWRDEQIELIAQSEETPTTAHSLSKVASSLLKKK